jgi:hypothetical protein
MLNDKNIVSENSFTLRFRNPTGTADSVYLFQSGAEPIGTTIITSQVNGVSYQQILESQNGAVYLVNGLTLNVLSAPSDNQKVVQLLRPFNFTKKDVNGDLVEIQKFQAIDPFQRQYSYSFVDLVDDGEQFALDGSVLFTYTIEANTSVNVTFNYIEVKNSNFDTEEGQKELEVNIEENKQLEENSLYAGKREIVVNSNADSTKESFVANKKRSYSWLWLILGGMAVYYIFTNKTNQKK